MVQSLGLQLSYLLAFFHCYEVVTLDNDTLDASPSVQLHAFENDKVTWTL